MAAIVEVILQSRRILSSLSRKNKCILFPGFRHITRNSCKNSATDDEYDIIITGGGMIGTTLACTLANNMRLETKRILLLEGGNQYKYEKNEQYSNRVVALNKHTKILLSSIGAWKHIEAVRVSSVRKMQIWDACSDAVITFNDDNLADEIAYIVENDLILHAVNTELFKKQSVKIIHNAVVEDIVLSSVLGGHSYVRLQNGQSFKTKLLIGADGQKSKVRKSMGVHYIDWDYDQKAVVATVKLSECTENIVAWQRFLPTGPVALLPLTDSLSSLVWSTTTEKATSLLQISDEEFVDNLNEALWKLYSKSSMVEGGMKALEQLLESFQLQTGISRQLQPSISNIITGSRAAFPLGFGHAVRYVNPGVALVGDAAHRVHPLAGQGVNLGFGDISALVQVLAETANNGALIGDITYLHKFESMRQWYNIPTMLAIDALHRLYKGTAPPIVLARSLGLQLTNVIKPLKNLIMQHAADQESVLRR